MAAYLLLVVYCILWNCIRMTTYTASVCVMLFRKPTINTFLFCDLHVFKTNIGILFFKLIVKSQSHNNHKGSIFKCHTTFDCYREFYRSCVITFMACLTQGDKIIGCISTCLTAFNVMHIKDSIFGLSLASLTLMTVTE